MKITIFAHVMSTIPKMFLLVLLAILTVYCGECQAGDCINWQRVMSRQYVDSRPAAKAIVVNSFNFIAGEDSDKWLSTGVKHYLASALSSARGIRIYTPETMQSADMAVEYRITGQFQRIKTRIRVFITLSKEGEPNPVKQLEVIFPFPDNKDFFLNLSTAAIEIIKTLGGSYDSKTMSQIVSMTSSTRAYEGFAKGLDVLMAFSPSSAISAVKWFEDAKRADYRSVLGYEGLVDVYSFLGFAARQRKDNYTGYFHLAEKQMAELLRLAKPEPLLIARDKPKVQTAKRPQELKINNALLLNTIAFQEGYVSMQAGDFKSATAAFKRAIDIVPDDAISWYYLASVYGSVGDFTSSSDAMQKAREINACVE